MGGLCYYLVVIFVCLIEFKFNLLYIYTNGDEEADRDVRTM